jgi:hypothetical protein
MLIRLATRYIGILPTITIIVYLRRYENSFKGFVPNLKALPKNSFNMGNAAPTRPLLVTWFGGFFPTPLPHDPWSYGGEYPINILSKFYLHEQQTSLKEASPPLVPNITVDDVAIHFRRGDVMGACNIRILE